MRQIILDTETTGLEISAGHRIIEIGCVELINRKLTQQRFHFYLNPQRLIDPEAIAIHGISNEFLQDKPLFSDIAASFIKFIEGAELIIHNAAFDVGFLDNELNLTQQGWQPIFNYCRITDTLAIARQLHVGQRNSLDALCKRYNIDNSKREWHGALLDAHLLAHVYLAMTGGQGSLFDDTQAASSSTTENILVQPLKTQHQLPLLQPSLEELAAHEAKLQKMAEKGKCIWLE